MNGNPVTGTPPEWNVGAELAALRGAMDTGFARLEGRLDLLVQSQDQVWEQVKDLDARVSALEARRWPSPSASWPLAGVVAAAGVLSAVGGYLVR